MHSLFPHKTLQALNIVSSMSSSARVWKNTLQTAKITRIVPTLKSCCHAYKQRCTIPFLLPGCQMVTGDVHQVMQIIGLHIWTLGQDPDLWCWSQLRTKNEHFTKALKENPNTAAIGNTRINRFHSPVSCQGFLFGPLIAINFKTGLYVRYDALLMAGPQNKHFTQAETHWAEWVFELYWLLFKLVLKLQLIVVFGWKGDRVT